MDSTKTLNLANLEALGAKRLAELLIELSTGNAAAKRQLRLALAGTASTADAASEITKRLVSIAKSRTFIDWRKVKPLALDLKRQHRAILDLVAPADPHRALDLLWRFVACAEPVFARSDDGSGRLAAIFRNAVNDLGPLAQAAKLDPMTLAERAFEAVQHDGYGQWGNLIPILAPQLGDAGLHQLRQLLTTWQAEPVQTPGKADRHVVAWSMASSMYADEMTASHRQRAARSALQQVADALTDVDGYIAQIDPDMRTVPLVAAAIAQRLLAAGRSAEAWNAIEAVPSDRRTWNAAEWEQVRVAVLVALDRTDEAQAFRWERFTATLDPVHLRAHLAALPDFDDFEAEQKAMVQALTHPDVHEALGFLVAWPNLERANQLVVARAAELNGDSTS